MLCHSKKSFGCKNDLWFYYPTTTKTCGYILSLFMYEFACTFLKIKVFQKMQSVSFPFSRPFFKDNA